ncbi:MAG: energy coupling factor transporter S component ThiW [Bilifractor sp.]|jgi:energy coupling factor transporter S component ThiW
MNEEMNPVTVPAEKAAAQTGLHTRSVSGGISLKKMVFTAMLACLGFVLNTFVWFPHMAPFQHFCNVMGAVFLGPWYNFAAAFLTGCMRVALDGCDFQAVIGAIFGALLSGFLYTKTHKLWAAWIGEVIGTGVISAVLASAIFNVALHIKYALFYLIPYYAPASAMGATLAIAVLLVLKRSKALPKMQAQLNR